MELLDDVCHIESHFGLFGESVSFGTIQVHGLCLMHHRLRNHFGHAMVLLGKGAQVEVLFGPFGDSVNLHARYIGAQFAWNIPYDRKSIQMHPMELLNDMCHMESRFGLFEDNVSFDARQVHSLRGMYHMLENQFGRTRWNSQMTCVIWNVSLVYFIQKFYQVRPN